MRDNLVVGFSLINFLFVGTGAALVAFITIDRVTLNAETTVDNIATKLILKNAPLNGQLNTFLLLELEDCVY